MSRNKRSKTPGGGRQDAWEKKRRRDSRRAESDLEYARIMERRGTPIKKLSDPWESWSESRSRAARRRKPKSRPKSKRKSSPITISYINEPMFINGQWITPDRPVTLADRTVHTSDEYKRYIASKEWHAKRTEYFNRYGYGCKFPGCDRVKNLQVHHHTYARFRHEDLSDLLGLCEEHHAMVHLFHDQHKKTMSLTKATEQVVGMTLRYL